nr:MAG TPA: hypothetical protein [Caudoviricetes sp.]
MPCHCCIYIIRIKSYFKFCVFYCMMRYTSYASMSLNTSRILFSASDNELRE